MRSRTTPLFAADIFCEATAQFTPVSPKKISAVNLTILKKYGLHNENLSFFTPKFRLINSSIYKIRSDKKLFILKSLDRKSIIPQRFLIAKKLQKNNFFPELMFSSQHHLFEKDKNRAYYLMKYEAGHYLGGDVKDLEHAISRVADLFLALKAIPTSSSIPRRDYFDAQDKNTFSWLKKAMSKKGRKPAHIQKYWSVFEKAYLLTKEALQSEKWTHHTQQLCHIDIHPHNVLLRDKKNLFFLDLEALCRGHRVACLGFSLFKILRNYVALQKNISPAKIKLLRLRLIKKLIEKRVLKPTEIDFLSVGARAENIKRFLHGFHEKQSLKGGLRLSIFGEALSGEIDFIFGEMSPKIGPS